MTTAISPTPSALEVEFDQLFGRLLAALERRGKARLRAPMLAAWCASASASPYRPQRRA